MLASPPQVLVVHRTIPSQNVRDRMHWRQRSADRDAWIVYLRAAVGYLPMRPTRRMHAHIVSLRARLIEDDANLRGGAKGLVDALVRLGFLRDDSDRWARLTYEQRRAPKSLRCTRITIAEVAG